MHTKSFVWIFIVFFSCQVIVDIFHSVTLFPFLHYGMYSEPFAKPDSIEIFEITANGETLNAGDFRMQVWDMIHSPLGAIQKQTTTGDFSFDKKKMRDAMQFAGLKKIYTIIEPNLNNDTASAGSFTGWYKGYLEKILGHTIFTLQVSKVYYHYDKGGYLVLKKEKWINI